MSTVTAHWGRRIRDARHHRGLTQTQLAELAGVSQSLISALELGITAGVRDATKVRIAAALEIPVQELFVWPEVA